MTTADDTPTDPESLTAALEAKLGPLDDLDPDTAAEVAAQMRRVAKALGGPGAAVQLAAAELLEARTRRE